MPKGISRIDSRTTHGWFSRVYRRSPMRTLSKLFSDSRYEDQNAALNAAKQWLQETRDNLSQDENPIPPMHKKLLFSSLRQ